MFPETYGRTLEELAFLFEDQALAEQATMKVEKHIFREDGSIGYEMGSHAPRRPYKRESSAYEMSPVAQRREWV